MSDAAFEAAVQMLNSAPAEPAPSPAPTPDAPTPPADAPPPVTPPAPDAPAAPEKPAPAAAPPAEDADAKLLADLEARRVARAAKQTQQPDVVAQLQRELAELKAKIAEPRGTPDLRALIAEHGEVEGLRRYGIDPLEFFDGFRKQAKAKDPTLTAAQQEAAAAKAATDALQKRYDDDQRTQQERQAAWSKQQSEAAYLRVTEDAGLGLQFLPKMDPAERISRTYAEINKLAAQGHDLDAMTDGELARFVDMQVRAEIRRLTGTDPGATRTPPTVPATDGATTKPPPASLTNDLASQSTGGRSLDDMSDKERMHLAVARLQQGMTE